MSIWTYDLFGIFKKKSNLPVRPICKRCELRLDEMSEYVHGLLCAKRQAEIDLACNHPGAIRKCIKCNGSALPVGTNPYLGRPESLRTGLCITCRGGIEPEIYYKSI